MQTVWLPHFFWTYFVFICLQYLKLFEKAMIRNQYYQFQILAKDTRQERRMRPCQRHKTRKKDAALPKTQDKKEGCGLAKDTRQERRMRPCQRHKTRKKDAALPKTQDKKEGCGLAKDTRQERRMRHQGIIAKQCTVLIWAAPSEFVSSSIPSWQILTAHAQPLRRARDLAFCLKVPLDSLLVWASSGGSGETARMRRLAWTFAARISDKYQNRLARPIYGFLLIAGFPLAVLLKLYSF